MTQDPHPLHKTFRTVEPELAILKKGLTAPWRERLGLEGYECEHLVLLNYVEGELDAERYETEVVQDAMAGLLETLNNCHQIEFIKLPNNPQNGQFQASWELDGIAIRKTTSAQLYWDVDGERKGPGFLTTYEIAFRSSPRLKLKT